MTGHCHENYSLTRYNQSLIKKTTSEFISLITRSEKVMNITLYLSEKFISYFEIFWAISEKTNFIFDFIGMTNWT